jgi:hypothetical protein
MNKTLFCGLEGTPIKNPTFADNSPLLAESKNCEIYPKHNWFNIEENKFSSLQA